MKRRARIQVKPNVVAKAGVAKPKAEEVSTDKLSSANAVNAVSDTQGEKVSDITDNIGEPEAATKPTSSVENTEKLHPQHLESVKNGNIEIEPSGKLVMQHEILGKLTQTDDAAVLVNRPFKEQLASEFVKPQPQCLSPETLVETVSCGVPSEVPKLISKSAKPTQEYSINGKLDDTDSCRVPYDSSCSATGPNSESVKLTEVSAQPNLNSNDSCNSSGTTKRRFTKVKPNISHTVKSKQSSGVDNVQSHGSSVVDCEPFVPPSVAKKNPPTDAESLPREESVVTREESVVILPEAAEKAATKIIARKLKQRRKRSLESIDSPIDSSKVCMRDLIYMNPVNNPMKSSYSDSMRNKVSKPSAPNSPAPLPSSPATPEPIQNFSGPQLKIGPDGSIILDQASLVIERQPVKTYEDAEVIDETDMVRCGYPKRTRTRSWTKKETRKFFAALSMIGTDFFLMTNLFPGRSRAELKRKFKREEKIHQAMVETALSERRNLDMSVMAVHSSDEEEVKPKTSKAKQPGKRGPRGSRKMAVPESEIDTSQGGKENNPQPIPGEKKRKKKKVPTATLR